MRYSEAVIGGARWRLIVSDDGPWAVARRGAHQVIWDELLAGNGGLDGVRETVAELRSFPTRDDAVVSMGMSTGADVLQALLDLAGRAA